MSSAEQVKLYCAQAEALIDHGRHTEAGERLAQALRLDPQSGLALGLMSLVKLRRGEGRAAVKLARQSIASEPAREWGHRVLSIALRASGNHKEALVSAREAARLTPESPEVLRNLALSLIQVRALEEARAVAERIVRLSPERAHGHEMLALVSAAQGRKDVAERHWRDALSRDPENPTFHNNLALVLLERGEHGQAVERFVGALRGDPKSDTYHANLGVGLERFRSAWAHYAMLLVVALLALSAISAGVQEGLSGAWSGPEGVKEATTTVFAVVFWNAIAFGYARHFRKWRKERNRVLPLLRTWRPRKRWSARFFASWRDVPRNPPLVVYLGLLMMLLVVALETELPLGMWWLVIPGGVVLWGGWRWIFWRPSPPLDTEL